MAKFEQTMAELGLTLETISNGLRDSIRTYKKAVKELNELEADLQNMGDDDESKQDLQSSIESIKADVEELDKELVKKIKKYHENKDFYDAKKKYMEDKAAGLDVKSPTKSDFQKVTASKPAATPPPPPQPAPEPQPEPVVIATQGGTTAQAAPAQSEPISVVAEEVKDEPKKKGSGNWILWAGLGVIGLLVGVNVLRNRE
jgi:uncharacterized membrane protein